MSDPISPIIAATQVLDLTSALVRPIEENEESPDKETSLTEILNNLRAESFGIIRRSRNQVSEMLKDFDRQGVPIDKSIPELIDDLHWYNFITRHRLNNARERFYAMHRTLTNFMDDVTSVMVCSGTIKDPRGAFWKRVEEKEKFDKMMASRPPVRQLLLAMNDTAAKMEAQLQVGEKDQ
ncbi:MAG: hypothetical protein ACLGJB_21755 [Blastocatellia bacterium]